MDMQAKDTIKCPLCGSDHYVEPELDDAVKEAFIESILGGVEFSRAYDELGGRITVIVSSIPDAVNRDKLKIVSKLIRASEITPEIRDMIPIIEASLDTDCQVLAVEIVDKQGSRIRKDRRAGEGIRECLSLDWSKLNTKDYQEVIDEMLNTLEAVTFDGIHVPIPILRGAVGKHNILMNKVMTACFDSNFIAGTGRDY